jgi:hypothetical protein
MRVSIFPGGGKERNPNPNRFEYMKKVTHVRGTIFLIVTRGNWRKRKKGFSRD